VLVKVQDAPTNEVHPTGLPTLAIRALIRAA
jgi:hypothetical protein